MGRASVTRAVLFADICDSTALYHTLGDTPARNIVGACISALSGVLQRFDGQLVKTLGDAMLCVFTTADLAVRAASEMQAVVTDLRPDNYPIAIHVGLHYGPVLVEENDVFGDTVNVAAYLTAVATREQILTTEAAERALSPELRASVRPVFHTVLKGNGRESVVYQVLWKTDGIDMTDPNFDANRVIPGDVGSLIVALEGERVRIDQWRQSIKIGRSSECDLVVADRYASRSHLTIRALRTRFYLIDHSINGTYVTLRGGGEVHVLRGEIPLDRSGFLCVGRSSSDGAPAVLSFEYDRRSMYRI